MADIAQVPTNRNTSPGQTVDLIELDDHTVRRTKRAPSPASATPPVQALHKPPVPAIPPDPELDAIAASWQPGTPLSACIMTERVERWQRRQKAHAETPPLRTPHPAPPAPHLTPGTGLVSRHIGQKGQVAR